MIRSNEKIAVGIGPATLEQKITLDIPSFMLSPYVLFGVNNTTVYALVDGGSPYSFINQDLWDKIVGSNQVDFKQKEIPSDNITLLGAFGKTVAKVLRSVLLYMAFNTTDNNEIIIRTPIRIIKGLNIPVIVGREFLVPFNAIQRYGDNNRFLSFDFTNNVTNKTEVHKVEIFTYQSIKAKAMNNEIGKGNIFGNMLKSFWENKKKFSLLIISLNCVSKENFYEV